MIAIDVDALAREAVVHPQWEKFVEFDGANPHIFDALVHATRHLKDKGEKKTAINRLVQDLRWDSLGDVDGQEGERAKLPNAFAPLYARMIAYTNPELADMFNFNPLVSAR